MKSFTTFPSFLTAALLLPSLSGCGGTNATADGKSETKPVKAAAPTSTDADAFVEKIDKDLKEQWTDVSRAEWVKSTYITQDTVALAAKANEGLMGYTSQAIKDAATFNGLKLSEDTARKLHLLKISSSLPAPSAPEKRRQLAEIAAKMESLYGAGKYCKDEADKSTCKDLRQLSDVIATSADYDELLEAWKGWRTIARPMKEDFKTFVNLGNEGAKEIGFSDMGDLWKSGYDMPPAEFEKVVEGLWQEVKPLYQDLHCYARRKLAKKYEGKFDAKGKIPAHLLGNMWAQDWAKIYKDLEPYKTKSSLDVDAALKAQGYDSEKMVRRAEDFFTSMGMKKLPDSFWERSQFLKPKDRDVVCHASAWDVTYENDVRIKMCIKVDEEDLITIHHELGHIYYYMYYYNLPVLYQTGAHDGFHEAIGDALALSVTPGYLKKAGILDAAPTTKEEIINVQLKTSLDKIAFLPFGRMIDQWRWDIFSGKVAPDDYNKHWWKLRGEFQGIEAPIARSDDDFDPGAKYHIPANVPYARYFLSFVLQFQFHKAMCEAAGFTGPLHECSIFGSKEAGTKLSNMLALGASKPWPEAMEALTGKREMSASAILEYFAPLSEWLKEENKDQQCGW
ncbi:MAG: M2 family metallopeptidase [Deltaproteobacteria bacterium]|nr:M2 family metallopeptidase [Deltaproteobacteria bacterium]